MEIERQLRTMDDINNRLLQIENKQDMILCYMQIILLNLGFAEEELIQISDDIIKQINTENEERNKNGKTQKNK